MVVFYCIPVPLFPPHFPTTYPISNIGLKDMGSNVNNTYLSILCSYN